MRQQGASTDSRSIFDGEGAVLVGTTPVGRATVAVLNINRADVILLRAALMEEGVGF